MHLLIFLWKDIGVKIRGDFAELFEGGFEFLDDFLSENVGMGGFSESSRLSKM